MSSIPPTCRALVAKGPGKGISVETIQTPQPTPGSLVVRIIHSTAEANLKHQLTSSTPGLHIPFPIVPGAGAIARVAAIGPDTTSLSVGQLVFLDSFIRGRDNSDVQLIWGVGVFGGDPRAIKLAEDVWRNGAAAEYVRIPLENCHPLNEKLLLGAKSDGGLGYDAADLCLLRRHLIVYSGLRGINLQAGETVIISPATGAYSGAAVEMASALGAKVVALGRNLAVLQKLAADNPRVKIVHLQGDPDDDLANIKKLGPVDAYLDISPPVANNTTHIRTCFKALGLYGRASLMGINMKDVQIPYVELVLKNISIRGHYMYEREDVQGLIKLVETGVLRLGKQAGHEIVGRFKLEEWEQAIDIAAANTEAGKMVVFAP